MYKTSMYNIEFKYKDNYYIFNTRLGSFAELPSTLSTFLNETNEIDEIYRYGFLVDNSIDEFSDFFKVLLSNINRPTDTLELTIVLTEECNFRCSYCYQTKKPKVFSSLDAQHLIKQIDELTKNSLNHLIVHYFGGEPLLNFPILSEIDRSLKSLSLINNFIYESYLTTNASLLTLDMINTISFTTIQLTFDGDASIHNTLKISDTFGYYDQLNLMRDILVFSDTKIKVRFNICYENQQSFQSVIDDILRTTPFDTNRVSFSFFPLRTYGKNRPFTELTPFDFANVDLGLRRYLLQNSIRLRFPGPIANPCKFSIGRAICIGPNLKQYFCSSDFQNNKPVDKLENFLNPKNIKHDLTPKCKKCTFLPLCLCSCKLLNPLKNACISEKYILTDLLKLYIDNPDLWYAND